MRYVRQRNDFSCGPVAILNVLKWSGEKVALDSELYKTIYSDCGCCIENEGSPIFYVRKAITKHCHKLRTRWVEKIKKDDVIDHLKNGGIIILAFEELGDAHGVAIIKDGCNFSAINYRSVKPYIEENKETISIITKNKLCQMLSNKLGLWLINK